MLQQIASAWQITSPILWTLVFGLVLRRFGIIGPRFIQWTNKLVFLVVLPFTLFLSIASKPLDQTMNYSLVGYGTLFTIISVITLWLLVRRRYEAEFAGVFVQSAYRGNMGIVGLTLIVGAYGDAGLVLGGFYLGINTITYNLCAVILLNDKRNNLLIQILKNPLIIGALAGLFWNLLSLPQPEIPLISLSDIVRFILPAALITIGASLSWSSFRSNHLQVLASICLKLILLPLIAVTLAWYIGFRGMPLGILFMMMATPTAAASYVMAQQMTRFGSFAAETVAVATMLSPVTMTAGLLLLKNLDSSI